MSTTTNNITSTEEPATKKKKTAKSKTTTAEVESVAKALRDRLEGHDNNRKEVQERLSAVPASPLSPLMITAAVPPCTAAIPQSA